MSTIWDQPNQFHFTSLQKPISNTLADIVKESNGHTILLLLVYTFGYEVYII